MCGFLYINNMCESLETKILDKYSEFSESRGPDDTNIVRKNKEVFIFSRLAISSFGTSLTQPLISSEDESVMMFNGEIYDYDGEFATDTEFLFDLIRKDELNLINNLIKYKGFFSIVHRVGNRLNLHRDFLGKKPLYYGYTFNNNSFFACSSLEVAIYLSGTSDEDFKKINRRMSKRTYHTLFKSGKGKLNEVEPGQTIQLNIGSGELTSKKVSLFEYTKYHSSDKSLEKRLRDAVNVRNEEKVTTTMALSGGIDSGILASYSSDFLRDAYFVDTGDVLEKNRAEEVANQNVIQLNQLKLSDYNFRSKYLISHLNNFMLHNLASEAASTSRVILVGEGADEIFLGYGRSKLLKKINKYKFQSKILNSRILSYAYAIAYFSTVTFPYILHYEDYKVAYECYLDFKRVYDRDNNLDDFTRVLEIILHQRPLIERVDACFTNNGIEARAVYLDPEIIDFSLTSDDVGKNELKAMYLDLFKNIKDIKKQGLSLEKGKGIRKRINEKKRVYDINSEVFERVIR